MNKAYKEIKHLQFDFVGILDSDISISPNYYEQLLARFDADSRLGLAGAAIVEDYGGRWELRSGDSLIDVGGQMPLFRRSPKRGFSHASWDIPAMEVNVGDLEQVTKAGAGIVHVTPPTFDEAKGGHAGYSAVLSRYSEWLLGQRSAAGWQVVGNTRVTSIVFGLISSISPNGLVVVAGTAR